MTIASSMFEKINDLGQRAADMEVELNEARQNEEVAMNQNTTLQEEV